MKFEEAIQKIQYGKCLLLTGAGFSLGQKITSKINLHFVLQNILHMNYTTNVMFLKKIKMTIYVERHNGIFDSMEKIKS